ncbi:MAG: Gfo/Idh/MocA family oxidoreductase [Thermoproteales archaeon]|nr:Gfo/Idh/MocA family oxidoreductase [Thermoproteales archaeon]
MNKLKIGFIGAGTHANLVHYPSLALMEDVEITAICDINPERLYMTAKKYNVKKTYRNYIEMLEKEDLDAVYVIMPPHILYDIVADVIQYGFNVFIEKPPGVTSFQTYNLARMAEKKNIIGMVGFNRRFIPLVRKTREIFEEYSDIFYCVSTFYKLYDDPFSYYRGAIDILTCDAIHAVDMLRWMCGDVIKVSSIIKKFKEQYNNFFSAILEFEKGKYGVLRAFWRAGARIHTFEYHGDGISAFVNPDDKAEIFLKNKKIASISTYEAAESNERIKWYGFYDENRHFIDCVKEGKIPETNFTEAYKTMRLVDEIYRNAI